MLVCLALQLVQRFAQLRNATPLEMLPQYKPGMHISGVDAELLSRTVAEFVSV